MPAALFVGLNVVDAFLTKTALSLGAVEFNPLMASIGSNVFAKGAIALLLAFLLYYFHQRRMLWILNVGLFAIVIWNMATCLIMDCASSTFLLASIPVFS